MSRKRDKPYLTRHDSAPLPKRRRPLPPPSPPAADEEDGDKPVSKPPPPPAVVVMGLSTNCSVLDLKSRFEIYGAISRIRIDRDGIGSITFRSKDSAEAAIAASLDASFGITIDSKRVKVLWATDPLAQWVKGVVGVVGTGKDNTSSSSSNSKLLRAGMPLSRHGRSNKLASAIVNPRSRSNGGGGGGGGDNSSLTSVLDVPFKGREIIAYDDIL